MSTCSKGTCLAPAYLFRTTTSIGTKTLTVSPRWIPNLSQMRSRINFQIIGIGGFRAHLRITQQSSVFGVGARFGWTVHQKRGHAADRRVFSHFPRPAVGGDTEDQFIIGRPILEPITDEGVAVFIWLSINQGVEWCGVVRLFGIALRVIIIEGVQVDEVKMRAKSAGVVIHYKTAF